MEYIHRQVESVLLTNLKPNKAILLLGARRVGKTELIKHINEVSGFESLRLHGGDTETFDLLYLRSSANYKRLMGDKKLLIIDEAQEIPEIGAKIKLMLDTIDGIMIIATGSSAFDLNNKIGEPLVGRKSTIHLYPFAQTELSKHENALQTKANLGSRLVLGAYPELESISGRNNKIDYLKEIINSYLLKDILAYEGIKGRGIILSLLRKIAYRVGSELSVEGLGNELSVSKNTIDKYLDLLSKVYIIHRVSGFKKNLDNEITKKNKWYFYDNGIRNAIIANFKPLEVRDDLGGLWENYLISERLKLLSYQRSYANHYFWRTHRMQEIDWIEEKDNNIKAYEFKWRNNKNSRPPKVWQKAYPNSSYKVITQDNYLDFIT